jgi:hypothetical protein
MHRGGGVDALLPRFAVEALGKLRRVILSVIRHAKAYIKHRYLGLDKCRSQSCYDASKLLRYLIKVKCRIVKYFVDTATLVGGWHASTVVYR